MNLPQPLGRSAAAHLPTDAADGKHAAVQRIADANRARTLMQHGIDAALQLADRYANHRCPQLLDAIPESRYVLDKFLDFALAEAADFAGDRLGSDATVALVVPMWVHNAVQVARTGPAYLTIPGLQPTGASWTLYALAAADRTPSLLAMSWDWCGAFPCITREQWQRDLARRNARQAA